MKKVPQYEMLPMSKIVPDENQPRKLFEPEKLKSLKDSIQKYGVMTPVTVEEINGKYLLQDGERRFRASKELGLKEIPAIIAEPSTEADRYIKQFHIQEQHENWTPTEKASTVQKLSKLMKLNIKQTAQVLGLNATTTARYIAFSELLEKKEYLRNEIGLDYAPRVTGLRRLAKKLYMEVLQKEFTQQMERDLELGIIDRIKSGQFTNPSQLTKLHDSFTKSPKMIEKFLATKISVDAFFLESKAHSVYYLRNGLANVAYSTSNFRKFLQNPDVALKEVDIATLKRAKKMIDEVLSKATLE